MPTVGAVFDIYLNVNILLIVAFGVWTILRFTMRVSGLKYAYSTKLHLIKAIVVTCFLAPVLVALFDAYLRPTGALSYSLSLSDLVVAQYVQGSLDVKATELETILGLRTRMTEDFLSAQGSFSLIAISLLAAGFLFGLGRLAISMVKLHRILDKCFTWRRFGRLHLLLSDTVTTPFSTRGLLNRYIVLPTRMLEHSTDQRIALGHELQHIRQCDTEWEIALEFLRPVFFWNPAYIAMKRQIERFRELSCDQQIIARRSMNVQDYCECLLRTCEEGLRRQERFVDPMPHVAFVQLDQSPAGGSSTQFLCDRLMSLIDGEHHQNRGVTLVALMIPILSLVGFASVMLQKPNDWSQDRIMFSTIINLDRMAERNYR